jgi:hypothetical protein
MNKRRVFWLTRTRPLPRRRLSRLTTICAASVLGVLLTINLASAGSSQPRLLIGIYDDAAIRTNPAASFSALRNLHAGVLRVNLHWGGPFGVAPTRPFDPLDPNDAAYRWGAYDQVVVDAAQSGIDVMFTIVDTPSWANHGLGVNYAPTNFGDLRHFAQAAATRYSSNWLTTDGRKLPTVRLWTAWNEPNNPVFLRPQFVLRDGRWSIESAVIYTRICNAVYLGVHGSLVKDEQVACGVTAPRGNNDPTTARASVSPLVFLTAVYGAGLRTFDAWAHNPYPVRPSEQPTGPRSHEGGLLGAVSLRNIQNLLDLLSHFYGNKSLWITEYGYQTDPPDSIAGVPWDTQARYLTEAFAVARANPRIELMLWFLLRDEPNLGGWQSGLETVSGSRKPSFDAFRQLGGS